MTFNVEERIEQFIARHGLGGQPYEVPNTSELHPRPGRCYQLYLTRQGVTTPEVLQVYVGKGIEKTTLASALWMLADEANEYGRHETFEQWNHENEGHFEHELGHEKAKLLYERSRDIAASLLKVLGEDLYQELLALVTNNSIN